MGADQGTIVLQASLGGFHAFEINEKSWILERGSYWASEASVGLSVHREKVWTSFWLGEGLIEFQTKVTGHGKVVLNSSGPVEEIELGD
ncbi:MAG: AIM24 family protein, partial [Isosphaeraceae bacterium]